MTHGGWCIGRIRAMIEEDVPQILGGICVQRFWESRSSRKGSGTPSDECRNVVSAIVIEVTEPLCTTRDMAWHTRLVTISRLSTRLSMGFTRRLGSIPVCRMGA